MENKHFFKTESMKFAPKPGVKGKYRREGNLAVVTLRGIFSYNDELLPAGLVRRKDTIPKIKYTETLDSFIKGAVHKDTIFHVEIEGWVTDWAIGSV